MLSLSRSRGKSAGLKDSCSWRTMSATGAKPPMPRRMRSPMTGCRRRRAAEPARRNGAVFFRRRHAEVPHHAWPATCRVTTLRRFQTLMLAIATTSAASVCSL